MMNNHNLAHRLSFSETDVATLTHKLGLRKADFPDSIVLHQQTVWVEPLIFIGTLMLVEGNEEL